MYRRLSGSWQTTGTKPTTVDSLVAGSRLGHAVDTNGDNGDWNVTGAPYADNEAGRVYFFKRNAKGTVNPGNAFRPGDISAQDRFGWSVAIRGGMALVGAPFVETANEGCVYVLKLNPSTDDDDDFIFVEVDIDGISSGEYALDGFSTDYVRVDGVPKEDALALTKIPINFPYVEVSVKLAAANLPPSECGGPFPYI